MECLGNSPIGSEASFTKLTVPTPLPPIPCPPGSIGEVRGRRLVTPDSGETMERHKEYNEARIMGSERAGQD